MYHQFRGMRAHVRTIALGTVGALAISTYVFAQNADDDLAFLDEGERQVAALESAQADQVEPAQTDEQAAPAPNENAGLQNTSQETPPTLDEANAARAAALAERKRRDPTGMLDELVVTAQKREQALQDVPLSISAIGEETIEFKDIDNMNAVQFFAPNLSVLATPTFNFINIRGMGSGLNAGFEQSVAIILDGVYLGQASYLNNALFDLQRIEVLRGPQGTLQGKNSVAGAISVVSADPGFDFAADISLANAAASYGFDLKATLNVPIVEDKLAVRMALTRVWSEGPIYNTTLNVHEANTDKWGFRSKILWNTTDNLTMRAAADIYNLKQAGPGHQLLRIAPEHRDLFAAFDPKVEDNVFDSQSSLDHLGRAQRKDMVSNLTFDYSWNDHTITWVNGYSTDKNAISFDADFSPVPFIISDSVGDFWQASSELRIASPDGPFNWIAGLFFYHADLDGYNELPLIHIDETLSGLQNALLGQAITDITGIVLGQLPLNADAENMLNDFDQQTTSYAAFAQATNKFNDTWEVTVGARVSTETKEVFRSLELTNTKQIWPALVPGVEEYVFNGDKTEYNFAPRMSLQHHVNEDVMLWLTIARGWKSGGFNASATNLTEMEFDAETSTTYEAGIKSQFMNGLLQFNLGFFHSRFEDLQVSSFNGTKFVVTNAASAITEGLELEGHWSPFEGMLINFTGSLNNGYYTPFPQGPCRAGTDDEAPCDLTDREKNNTTPYMMTLFALYDAPIRNSGLNWYFSAEFAYAARSYGQTDLDDIDKRNQYFGTTFRVGARDVDNRWSATFTCLNCTEAKVKAGADSPVFAGTHFGGAVADRYYIAHIRMEF